MAIRMSGRGLRICGGDEEGMRDEIRRCTRFDGFNMGSTEGRKEGRKDIVLGTGPGKGSHKTLKACTILYIRSGSHSIGVTTFRQHTQQA
jgi:hypothetical protein